MCYEMLAEILQERADARPSRRIIPGGHRPGSGSRGIPARDRACGFQHAANTGARPRGRCRRSVRRLRDASPRQGRGAQNGSGLRLPPCDSDAGTGGRVSIQSLSNEHSTPAQRTFNILCIAYGADKKLFADIVEKDFLPKERAEVCAREYDDSQLCHDKADRPAYRQAPGQKISRSLGKNRQCPARKIGGPIRFGTPEPSTSALEQRKTPG